MNCVNTITNLLFLSALFYNESHARSTELFNLLSKNCGPNLTKDVLTLLRFSSKLCSETSNPECQSDCKSLLQNLQHKCELKKDDVAVISRTFKVPESCFDFMNGLYSTKNHPNVTQVSHFMAEEFCRDNDSHVAVGTVSYKPCSEVLGPNVEGDIQRFCSSSGSIITDVEQCYYSEELMRAADRLNHLPNATTSLDPFNYAQDSVRDFISQTNENINVFTEFGKVLTSTGVTDLVNFVSRMGRMLGPIGEVFSFLGALLPGENKEHKELLNKLDTLEVKIGEVNTKIDELRNHVTNEIFMLQFRQMSMKLIDIEHDIRRYVKYPSDLTKKYLKKICMENPSVKFVQWFLQITTKEYNHEAFANMFSYNRNDYNNRFGKPGLAYLMRSLLATMKCIGVLAGTKQDIDNLAKDLREMSQVVTRTVSYTYNNYIPDKAISKTLERDVNDMLRRYEGWSNDDVRGKFMDELNRKYDYVHWGVNAYSEVWGFENHIMGTSCFQCEGKDRSGSYWIYRHYGRCLNLMYTNTRLSLTQTDKNRLATGKPRMEDKYKQLWNHPSIRNVLIVKWGNGLRSTYFPSYVWFQNMNGYASLVASD